MTVNLNQRVEVRSVSMTRATPDVDESCADISSSCGLNKVGVARGIFLPHLTRLTLTLNSLRYWPFLT